MSFYYASKTLNDVQLNYATTEKINVCHYLCFWQVSSIGVRI